MRLDTVWLGVIDRLVWIRLIIRLIEFNWRLNLADYVALLMCTGNLEADSTVNEVLLILLIRLDKKKHT